MFFHSSPATIIDFSYGYLRTTTITYESWKFLHSSDGKGHDYDKWKRKEAGRVGKEERRQLRFKEKRQNGAETVTEQK